MSEGALQSPRDKHDFEMVEQLKRADPTHWKHLVPGLLAWLQDQNWPIWRCVKEVLLRDSWAVIEPLHCVLQGCDTEWQFNCLLLIQEMPVTVQALLRDDLTALRKRVTDGLQDDWGMEENIDEILSKII